MSALATGAGFVNLNVGARGVGGSVEGFARGEFGAHFAPAASVFGFGEAALSPGSGVTWQTGIGLRANF